MQRRNLLQLACAIMPVSVVVTRAEAATPQAVPPEVARPDMAKVVYHVDEIDKVDFAFGNIKNHYAGMGGPDKVTIAMVVLGPALKAFHTDKASKDVMQRTDELKKNGLALNACINTMKAQEVTLKDLLPGFIVADKGGVVKIAELQAQGYVYIRP